MSAPVWDYTLPFSDSLVQLTVPTPQSLDGVGDSDLVRFPEAVASLGMQEAKEQITLLINNVVLQSVLQPSLTPTPLDSEGYVDYDAIDPDVLYVHDLLVEDRIAICTEVNRVSGGGEIG